MNGKIFSIFLTIVLLLSFGVYWKQDLNKNKVQPRMNQHIEAVSTSVKQQEVKPEVQQNVQKRIRDYLQRNNLSGSFAIVRGNKVIFNGGAGYADRSKKQLSTSMSTFPIGSITKTFVATSIMQLQEKGKLNIYDPISKYVPGFPNGKKIKLYNLLTHTSGIQAPHNWGNTSRTPLSLVKAIESMPIKFPAGSQWDYRDANYMVLGYVVQKVSGMNLHTYIQKNIFDKIPMKDSGFITRTNPVPYNTVSYLMKDNLWITTKYMRPDVLFGCGDIYTTAYDLTKYDEALMDGKLISHNSLKQVLTPSRHSSYGLGLYTLNNKTYSFGVLAGWFCMHEYFPDKTSIAIYLNVRVPKIRIERIMDDLYQMVKSNDQQIALTKKAGIV